MIDVVDHPGQEAFSSAQSIGAVLADYMAKHPDFYLFSPDETTSNKLDAVYEVSERAWDLPQESFDLPESIRGQIIEVLSENALFATMVGHLASGSKAVMTSYEAFFMIIASQILQQLKFMQQSQSVKWRPDCPAVNLLSTSTCWRQDHNGFTHQSPALISLLLNLPSNLSNCLFPVDDVAAEAALIYMLEGKNVVNLTTFNKTEQPRWLDSHQADKQFSDGGVQVFETVSDEQPDYILAGVGDIMSNEAIAAIETLRKDLPGKKYRFVNISALSYNAIGTTERKLGQDEFDRIFTVDKPIVANFHGYPDTLAHILMQYTDKSRLHTHGFGERGSTTTPFEMLRLNHTSRYDLAIDIAKLEGRDDLVQKYEKILADNAAYAKTHGIDQIQ